MLSKLTGRLSRNSQIAGIVVSAAAVGLFDYWSGAEFRAFPLYFFPIAIAASVIGRDFALLVCALCTVLWLVSNGYAGMRFSSIWVWLWNTATLASAFVLVGLLVSRLQASVVKERESARVDSLTGLLNTRAFYERAPAIVGLCRRESRPLVIAYIDLDNFKDVNDSQGHQRGDAMLCIAARVMQARLRATDLLARFGGDEFAALLPNASPDAAAETLERLRASIESAMSAERCNVTASIGACAYRHAPADLEEIIRAADGLMYSVKNSGRNRVRVSTIADEA